MVIDAFDMDSPAIINPPVNLDAPAVDACIVTFSCQIEQFVLQHYPCEKMGEFLFATGAQAVYRIPYQGKVFGFYKTYVGAPACVGTVEDTFSLLRTSRYVVFGGAGCLCKEIAHGKVMVPTEAYRDEGTSYHYAPASDYITVKNAEVVAAFMRENGIPFVMGKTWTTDSFYRETVRSFEKRRAEGCISVEMECAGLQAMCDFRGLQLYTFFTSGDLLDAPEWDTRCRDGETAGTQHDAGHFDIALALAHFVATRA